mgnify:CR=1 FL=1
MKKACYFKTMIDDCVMIYVIGETKEDDLYFAYYQNEKWNGEYYKGWQVYETGEAVDSKLEYKIKPLYDDKEGYDYEIEVL